MINDFLDGISFPPCSFTEKHYNYASQYPLYPGMTFSSCDGCYHLVNVPQTLTAEMSLVMTLPQ